MGVIHPALRAAPPPSLRLAPSLDEQSEKEELRPTSIVWPSSFSCSSRDTSSRLSWSSTAAPLTFFSFVDFFVVKGHSLPAGAEDISLRLRLTMPSKEKIEDDPDQRSDFSFRLWHGLRYAPGKSFDIERNCLRLGLALKASRFMKQKSLRTACRP